MAGGSSPGRPPFSFWECVTSTGSRLSLMLPRPCVVRHADGGVFGNLAPVAQVGVVLETDLPGPSPRRGVDSTRRHGAAVFGGSAAAVASSSIGLDAGVSPPSCCLPFSVAEAGKAADRFVRKGQRTIARITAEVGWTGDIQAVGARAARRHHPVHVTGMVLALVFSWRRGVSKELLPRYRPRQPGELAVLLPGASAPGSRLGILVQPYREDRRRVLPGRWRPFSRHRAVPGVGMTPPPALATPVPGTTSGGASSSCRVLELRGDAERGIRIRHPPGAA